MAEASHDRISRNPTRRRLLSWLVGTAVFVRTGAPRAEMDGAAHGEERADTVLARGVAELRERVLMDPREELAFFIRKGATAEWIYPPAVKHRYRIRVPFSEIGDALVDPKARVTVFHTHHAGSTEHAGAPVPRPPSFGDVYFGASLHAHFGAAARRISQKVVDPTGVWAFALDSRNRHMQKLISAIEATNGVEVSARTEEEIDTAYAAGRPVSRIDWRYKVLRLRAKGTFGSLSVAARHEIDNAMAPFKAFLADPACEALMHYRRAYDERPDVRNVERVFRTAGVPLSYAPFKD